MNDVNLSPNKIDNKLNANEQNKIKWETEIETDAWYQKCCHLSNIRLRYI